MRALTRRIRLGLVLPLGAVTVTLILALTFSRVSAWDTSTEAGWQSVYLGATLGSKDPNEHTHLSTLAVQALGLDARLGIHGDAAIAVTDLNASLFHQLPDRFGRLGDDASTPLEERRIPTASHFAGLPDFSYTLYDWIHKNNTCPVLPQGAPYMDKCHLFSGWMGVFNANHFGSQTAETYRHYHQLALGLARRAAAFRQTVALSNSPDELRFHDRALREMEIEALTFEGIAQHYLQDRWSSGHMWERWNGANYGDFLGPFDVNWLVGAVSGLLHGSESITTLKDLLGSPAVLYAPDGSQVIDPARWTNASGTLDPKPAVGDWRLGDLMAGTFTGSPLRADEQRTRMLQCMQAGWAETIRALGTGEGAGYGVLRLALPDRTPALEEGCWDAWATDAAIEKAILSRDWVTRGTSLADKLPRIDDLVNLVPDLGFWEEEYRGLEVGPLYPIYRREIGRIGARIKAQQIRNARNPTGYKSTALARGGLGRFATAHPGNDARYGLAAWLEPTDLNTLPETSLTGRDRQTLFGFFSLSHLDHWARSAESLFPTLRGSSDRVRQAACVFLARQMYQGTIPGYQGRQREWRTVTGGSDGTKVYSLAIHHGITETQDHDAVPIVVAPGYVGGDERGTQTPWSTTEGVPQTIRNWCAAPPLLQLMAEADGSPHREDLVAVTEPGGTVTLPGLRLGSKRGSAELFLSGGDGKQPEIGAWKDDKIELQLPEEDFPAGDYRVIVTTADGRATVGRFLIRIATDGSAPSALPALAMDPTSFAPGSEACVSPTAAAPLAAAVAEAEYKDELAQKRQALQWRRDWMRARDERVTAAENALRALEDRRADLRKRLASVQRGFTDIEAEFRNRERRLVERIDRNRRTLATLEQRLSQEPGLITQRDWTARNISQLEGELRQRQARWHAGEGRGEADALRVMVQYRQRYNAELEEIRWDTKRAAMELEFALDARRKLQTEIDDLETELEGLERGAPMYLERVPPPFLLSVDAGRYRATWQTQAAELERIDRAIAITDTYIGQQRHLIRNVEFDLRATEHAFLDSDQRWQELWDRYSGWAWWEAGTNIALELVDSYENIFGLNSPRAALRANPIAAAGSVVVEAVFRVTDAIYGERPTFPDPQLGRELIEQRNRIAGNPAAEAAVAYQLNPAAYRWVTDGAPGAPGSFRRDIKGYPTIGERFVSQYFQGKEHLKSQLQQGIESWSESSLRSLGPDLSRRNYWTLATLRARGIMEDLPAGDPMRQAATLLYASAGQQRELAGTSLRRLYSAQNIKGEALRFVGGAGVAAGKDAIKTVAKETLRELVLKGKLEAFLDTFAEDLAYYAFRREYVFTSARLQRERLNLEALVEVRADLLRERDRLMPGRVLQVTQNDPVEQGRHTLHLRFTEPVADVTVRIEHAEVGEPVLAADGLSAELPFTLRWETGPPAQTASLAVTARAVRTEKTVDGNPRTIACHVAGGWRNYENAPDQTHRLLLRRPGGGVSFVFLVDASGSMGDPLPSGQPKLEAAKESLKRWLRDGRRFPTGSEVAVWTISGQPNLLLDFTTDTAAVIRVVESLTATSGTPLVKSIVASGTYLITRAQNRRKIFVVFSDGEDSDSSDPESGLETVRKRATAIYREGW